jgi:hypothetical protein
MVTVSFTDGMTLQIKTKMSQLMFVRTECPNSLDASKKYLTAHLGKKSKNPTTP